MVPGSWTPTLRPASGPSMTSCGTGSASATGCCRTPRRASAPPSRCVSRCHTWPANNATPSGVLTLRPNRPGLLMNTLVRVTEVWGTIGARYIQSPSVDSGIGALSSVPTKPVDSGTQSRSPLLVSVTGTWIIDLPVSAERPAVGAPTTIVLPLREIHSWSKASVEPIGVAVGRTAVGGRVCAAALYRTASVECMAPSEWRAPTTVPLTSSAVAPIPNAAATAATANQSAYTTVPSAANRPRTKPTKPVTPEPARNGLSCAGTDTPTTWNGTAVASDHHAGYRTYQSLCSRSAPPNR